MYKIEDSNKDYKSLKKAIGSKSDVSSIAETCVCFANAQGGKLIIGIEDNESVPPTGKKIDVDNMNKMISRIRDLTHSVGITNPVIKTHSNGGEYFTFRILPSTRTIATTSSGKVFM